MDIRFDSVGSAKDRLQSRRSPQCGSNLPQDIPTAFCSRSRIAIHVATLDDLDALLRSGLDVTGEDFKRSPIVRLFVAVDQFLLGRAQGYLGRQILAVHAFVESWPSVLR